MKVLRAVHVSELPGDPDLIMVFEAKKIGGVVKLSGLKGQRDAGALALTEWMVKHNIDMIYE